MAGEWAYHYTTAAPYITVCCVHGVSEWSALARQCCISSLQQWCVVAHCSNGVLAHCSNGVLAHCSPHIATHSVYLYALGLRSVLTAREKRQMNISGYARYTRAIRLTLLWSLPISERVPLIYDLRASFVGLLLLGDC